MALEQQIGGNGDMFFGEDKTLELTCLLLTAAERERFNANPDDQTVGSVRDMTGWTVKFGVRVKDDSVDPLILDKTASITGVYNASRALNTQKAAVVLTDTETLTLTRITTATVDRPYRYSFKRTDDGVETVLAYGDLIVEEATER